MILIAGATGYIGSRVLKNLSERCFEIRCLVRKPTIQKLNVLGIAKDKNKNISYVEGNALDYNSLLSATQGVDVVYYFIHMMDLSSPKDKKNSTNLIARRFKIRLRLAKKIILKGSYILAGCIIQKKIYLCILKVVEKWKI